MAERVFTERDQDVLTALVLKVRLFSLRQIARHWWHGETVNARRRLKILAHAGLVACQSVPARSLPKLNAPIVVWKPGDRTCDFGAVAHQLQTRWRHRAIRLTSIYMATPRAAQVLGGAARSELKAPTQTTHDLGVAQVWLHLDRTAPHLAEAWCGEDVMEHTRIGQKRPDAFLVDDHGTTVSVVEFGGGYDTARVRAFHQDCVSRSLPYEIW